MRAVLAIAGNTVREALRERLMYNLVAFAVVLIVGSLTISELTLGEQRRIIVDVGSSATQVFGILIAVFVGVGLISKELERRTCYPALARPIGRGSFLVGKYAGLLVVLALNLAVMGAATAGALAAYARAVPGGGFAVVFAFFFLQFAIAAAFAVLFSSFTTATLATIFTLSFVAAGYVFAEVRTFWLRSQDAGLKPLVRLLDVFLPNMGLLDLKAVLVYGDPIRASDVLLRTAYGAGYAAVLVAIAAAIFSRRDVR